MKIYIISIAVFFVYYTIGYKLWKLPQKPYSGSCTNRAKQWAKMEGKFGNDTLYFEAEQILLQYNDNDYNALAEQLKNKNNGLIKSCTMDGKSHEELHKWLHPHIQLIDALEDAENKEEADKIISELKASFQTYHNYFQ
ncbi:MAG: hypothetical protein R2784_14740 [Saprospiraceae bacterium]